jgi:hypothetical protein
MKVADDLRDRFLDAKKLIGKEVEKLDILILE